MTTNKTEQALKIVAIQFSVDKSLDWEDALLQAMDIIKTDSREQAVFVLGQIIKELHD